MFAGSTDKQKMQEYNYSFVLFEKIDSLTHPFTPSPTYSLNHSHNQLIT